MLLHESKASFYKLYRALFAVLYLTLRAVPCHLTSLCYIRHILRTLLRTHNFDNFGSVRHSLRPITMSTIGTTTFLVPHF